MTLNEAELREKVATAGDRAIAYKEQGFHCSESVFLAINEVLGITDPCMVRAVTGFHGGGGTHRLEPEVNLTGLLEDVAAGRNTEPPIEQVGHLCGALASGIASMGLLHGRCTPTDDLTCVDELCFELHRRFSEELGEKNCKALREKWVPLSENQTCDHIYRVGARLAVEIALRAEELVAECMPLEEAKASAEIPGQ